MRTDEREAILKYESKLLKGHKKATAHVYLGDIETRNRLALAVFRHTIENILKWDPDTAFANMSPQLIADLNLKNEWNNLNLPREIKQNKSSKYVIAMLYPKRFMRYFSIETLAIQVYRASLEQRRGIFPKNYFIDRDGYEKARICLRYMLSNYAVYPNIETMYREFADTEKAMALLHHFGLSLPARIVFDSPLDYLHETLVPPQKNDLFYNFYRFSANLAEFKESADDANTKK